MFLVKNIISGQGVRSDWNVYVLVYEYVGEDINKTCICRNISVWTSNPSTV